MKKAALAVVITMLGVGSAFSQASPVMKAEGENVSVSYGQPSKKGRVIFGKDGTGSLETYGKVWRTGANGATEVSFAKDVVFGGTAVKAGKYTLYTIPGEAEWTVILNSELKQWGAYNYEKVKDKNVAVVKVAAKKLATPVEKLTFEVKDNSLQFAWDQACFAVPMKF